MSRRDLLRGLTATAGVSLFDPGPVLLRLLDQPAAPGCEVEAASGRLVATLPLSRPDAPAQPFGVKIGAPGLDARLITDLSRLEPGQLSTPAGQIYIRTECPAAVAAHRGPWTIRTSGLIASAAPRPLEELTRGARAMGAHLLECSGNSNPANFGLMSVADWSGVPLATVVDRLRPSPGATAVLVSGVDPDQPSLTSITGASWVFPLASLDALGAFLAVKMNGEPLPLDHGRPVRLVVPGWYGCSWIKWVDEIRLVGAAEPATSQMREFAGRTHQTAAHTLARDYAPPAIQTAATVVRVEKRRGDAGLHYRVVGLVWGGTRAIDRLAIRFRDDDTWRPFEVCPAPRSAAVWSMWTYLWKPATPGLYDIRLQVPDASVPQRRLDSGYYVRQVSIDEV